MTDHSQPLDPDEITCRTCDAAPGEVCRQPNGRKAREIHVQRRRDAAAGNRPQPTDKREPRGPSPATPEGRSKGGRRTAQERKRRASEIAAAVEEQRAQAEAAAIEEEARKLAEDASRYARDRAELRRLTLSNALKGAERLGEAIRDLRRVELDDEGKPKTTPVEVFDKEGMPVYDKAGDRVIREELIVRGYVSARDVETLSKAAAQQLASVRLEEGKPTGILEQQGAGQTRDLLGEAGVRELIEFAARELGEERPS